MTYWVVPNVDWALHKVANAPAGDHQYFYVVESDRPVALYADFDAPRAHFASYGEFRNAVTLCLAYLCRFLDASYGVTLSQNHYDGEWRLFEACSATKWSMHAHCRLCFRNVALLNSLIARFIALIGRSALRRHDSRLSSLFYEKHSKRTSATERHCILDCAVYNSRPFRLPHCRKSVTATNYLRPLLPEAEGMRADIRWGFAHEHANVPWALDAKKDFGDTICALLEQPLQNWDVLSANAHMLATLVAGALHVDVPVYAQQPCAQDLPDCENALQQLRDSRVLRKGWALALVYLLHRYMLTNQAFVPQHTLSQLAIAGFDHTLQPQSERAACIAQAIGIPCLCGAEALCDDYLTLPEMCALVLFSSRFEPNAAESDADATRRLCKFAQFASADAVFSSLSADKETRDALNKDLAQFTGAVPEQLQPLSMLRFLPLPLNCELNCSDAPPMFSFLTPQQNGTRE
jgi:hypothetical protein